MSKENIQPVNSGREIQSNPSIEYAILSEEKYSLNPELDKEYKKLTNSVNSRFKNVIFYNICMCFAYYYCSRNIVYFRKRIYGKRDFTYSKVIRTILFYTFIPTLLLIPNVFLLFGIHPIKYFREKRELEEKLLTSKELKDTIFGIDHMYKREVMPTMVENDEIDNLRNKI